MAANLVKDKIANNKVMIFSKSYCPYCERVKALFTSLKVPFTALELDEIENGPAIQNALKDLTGGTTVPRVFIKGEHIGGNDDTQELHRSGGLVPKLKAAGIDVSS
jgi:glutaredoxin